MRAASPKRSRPRFFCGVLCCGGGCGTITVIMSSVSRSAQQLHSAARLTEPVIKQLNEMLAEAAEYTHAEITLVVKRGRLRWIRPPVIHVAVKTE